jgi:hypothetical protein
VVSKQRRAAFFPSAAASASTPWSNSGKTRGDLHHLTGHYRTVRVPNAGMQMNNGLVSRILLCCASLLLVVSATAAHAQDTAPPARANAIYVELLGKGGDSVNYERALTPALRMRVGAASWTSESFWSDDAKTRY